ncbi:hypothetical protein Q1695_001413 [Nippostrongylus brasiliensis]|nr:hypothetical protein Q1695_001413 [Nippostrongylus brasiliensis]
MNSLWWPIRAERWARRLLFQKPEGRSKFVSNQGSINDLHSCSTGAKRPAVFSCALLSLPFSLKIRCSTGAKRPAALGCALLSLPFSLKNRATKIYVITILVAHSNRLSSGSTPSSS